MIYDLNLIEEEIIKTEKELEILLEESFIAGVAVSVIPTLIKLIIFLIDKLFALILTPFVLALLNKTDNIRSVGGALMTGETSVREVVSSITPDKIRTVLSSGPDPAKIIENVNDALSDAAKNQKKTIRQQDRISEYALYNDLSPKDIFKEINKEITNKVGIDNVIDLDVLKSFDKIEKLEDLKTFLSNTEVNYFPELTSDRLDSFKDSLQRYDLVKINNVIGYLGIILREYIDNTIEPSTQIAMEKDYRSKDNTFNMYIENMLIKIKHNGFEKYIPKELLENHFKYDNENNMVNNFTANAQEGDFKTFKDNNLFVKDKLYNVFETFKFDVDNVHASMLRSLLTICDSPENSKKIKAEYDILKGRLEHMKEELEKEKKETNEEMFYYIKSFLNFAIEDIKQITATVQESRKRYHENYNKMLNLFDNMVDGVCNSVWKVFLSDIKRNHSSYNIDEQTLNIILDKYESLH